MKIYSTISKCRVCGSKELTKLFSLGELYISTFVENKGENIGKAPLALVYCENCTLVQLKHTAPQELLYSGNYWYESALNQVIIDDLRDIVQKAVEIAKPKVGDYFLDIGANDGTLLSFVPKEFYRLGIEPAKNLENKIQKIIRRNGKDGYSTHMWEDVNGLPGEKPKVITAIGMFYDSEDPNKFIGNVKKHLADDGLFIAQMMTSKAMLDKNDVGNICHEHLEFYSYDSLKFLFEKNGLEIFRVEENTINGGSYRLYARHFVKGSVKHPEKITKKDYMDFYKRICKNREKVSKFIENKVIYGYGASTKGNTILQWYDIKIKGIAEIHPDKIGKLTVGSEIPIVSEAEAKEKAEYLLVLPYAFKESFIKREAEWLSAGGKFIFTTPELEII